MRGRAVQPIRRIWLWEGTEEEFKQHTADTLERIHNNAPTEFSSIDDYVEASREGFEKMGWWSEIFESVKRYDAHKIGENKYIGSWGIIAEDYTKYLHAYRFEEYYKRVKCPVLMLPDTYPGQDDREKEVMNGLFKLLDQGKIVHIPKWVHPFGWVLDPAGGSKVVLSFLAEISG